MLAVVRLQRRQARRQQIDQPVVELPFARERALARTQHLVLEGLQFGRDEPFGGFHGLAALIVLRYRVRLASG